MQNKTKRVPFGWKFATLFTILLLVVAACSSDQPNNTPKVISGVTVFRDNCMNCHGADGNLGMNGAKRLPESTLTLEERIQVVTEGRNNVMPAFKTLLSEQKIKAAVEYTMQLSKKN